VEQLDDMVVHGGEGQGQSWHDEAMSCHGMAWFPLDDDARVYPGLSEVIGSVEGGQWSTFDELGMRVYAKNHWFLQCMGLAGSCTQGARPNGRKNFTLEFWNEIFRV
jgi:hypothetical protein